MTEQFKVTEFRDNMLSQMIEKIRFNRFDMKFMSNIMAKYILHNKQLSPGQNELYEKLIHKYRKQFKKLGVSYKAVIAAEWKHGLVSEETLAHQTLFKITDDVMTLAFNFNKKMIEEVRELLHDDNAEYLRRGTKESIQYGTSLKYDFTWSPDSKIWSGAFNTYLFKNLYYFCAKHGILLDDSVNELFRSYTSQYGTRDEFTPQLKITNGRMYISLLTESMLPYLKDIDMTDLSVQNIEKLTKLGIKAPAEYKDVSQYVSSYSHKVKHVIHDEAEVNVLKAYIKSSKRKCILYMPHSMFSPSVDILANGAAGMAHLGSAVVQYHDSDRTDLDKLRELSYNTLITTMPIDDLIRSQKQIGTFALNADKVIYISIAEKI